MTGGDSGAGAPRSWAEALGTQIRFQMGNKGSRMSGHLRPREPSTRGERGGDTRSTGLHQGLTRTSAAATSATPSPTSCRSSVAIPTAPHLRKRGAARRPASCPPRRRGRTSPRPPPAAHPPGRAPPRQAGSRGLPAAPPRGSAEDCRPVTECSECAKRRRYQPHPYVVPLSHLRMPGAVAWFRDTPFSISPVCIYRRVCVRKSAQARGGRGVGPPGAGVAGGCEQYGPRRSPTGLVLTRN